MFINKKYIILLTIICFLFLSWLRVEALTVASYNVASACPGKTPYNCETCSVKYMSMTINGFTDNDTSDTARTTPVPYGVLKVGEWNNLSVSQNGSFTGGVYTRYGCGDSVGLSNDDHEGTVSDFPDTSPSLFISSDVNSNKYCKIWIYAKEWGSGTWCGKTFNCGSTCNVIQTNECKENCRTVGVSNTRAFEIHPTLTVTKSGNGSVSGTGISCGSDCSETYYNGEPMITLTATPSTGYTFSGWSCTKTNPNGTTYNCGCAGTGTCTVKMDRNVAVTATFVSSCANTPCSRCSNNTDCQKVAWTDCAATCSEDPTTSGTVKANTLTRTYDSTCNNTTNNCKNNYNTCGICVQVDSEGGTCLASQTCSRCSTEETHACEKANWTNCGDCDTYNLGKNPAPTYTLDCANCVNQYYCYGSVYNTKCGNPDLIIESIAINPSNPVPGQPVTITVREKNNGNGNAGGHYIDLKIDNNSLGPIPVSSLNGTQFIDVQWSYSCPSGACNSYTLTAMADSSYQITESNENNNTNTNTFSCSSSYDISLSASTYNVANGANVTLSWTTSGMQANSCIASADPYNSQWTGPKSTNTSNNSQTITNLTQTTTFYLTCNDLCGFSRSDSQTVTVGSNPLSVSITAGTCSSGSVIATSTASGGTGSYSSYEWYADGSYKGTTYGSTNSYTYTNLSNSSHSLYVTVKDSSNATATSPHTTVTCDGGALSVSITAGTCSSGSVTATATVSGGSGSYWYFWYDGNTSVGFTDNQNTYTYNNLSSGDHDLSVSIQDKSTFNTATSPQTTVTCGGGALSVSITAGTCSSGSVTATATISGGSGSYWYFWYDGNTSVGFTDNQNTYTYNNLSSGDHDLSVSIQDKSTFNIATSPQTTVTCGGDNSLSVSLDCSTCFCSDEGEATVTATASGGSGSYYYCWADVTKNISYGCPFSPTGWGATSTFTFTGLTNGNHDLQATIADANNPSNTAQSNICSVSCSGGGSLTSISIDSFTIPGCSNGNATATVIATGGSGEYDYHWYVDDTYVTTTYNVNQYTYSGLAAGNHSFFVYVYDHNNSANFAKSDTISVDCSTGVTLWKCDSSQSKCVSSDDGTWTSESDCNANCQCIINDFSINNHKKYVAVLKGQILAGHLAVNDVCLKCEVISNNDWNNIYDPVSLEENNSFSINEVGNYKFTLNCYDKLNNKTSDEISLQVVRVLPLPWWREIIPNLGGFLRGLWK